MSIGEIIAIGLAGLAAGAINTLVGSGTLITFPVLLAFGYPPVTANVSNTIGLVPGSEGGGGGADIPAPYLYKVPNTRVKQTAVVVNAGSARAFRAPGNPPASFGMESAMDDLAVKLGMDPVELRLKNDPSPIRQREYT